MNFITEIKKGEDSEELSDDITPYLEKVYDPNIRKLLYKCYQCVRCSGVCQLSKVQTFEPSRIIQMILEGFEDKIIESGILWDCLTCNACLQNCPEGINFADIVRMAKYKCTVCGYIYDPEKGDPDSGVNPGTAFEQIPEDWVCPVCGIGKDQFERID